MAGRTISAYVDEAIADRVQHIAEVEDRNVSQLTASALGLYTLLPREAHAALRRVEAFGEPEDLVRAARQVARALIDIQYEVAERSVAQSSDTRELGDLDSEEAILEAATRLVRAQRSIAGRRSPSRKLRKASDRAPSGARRRSGAGSTTRSSD